MGLFNKNTKVTPQQMGGILYAIGEEQSNFMTNSLNELLENRQIDSDAAFLIPVMYNFFLYIIPLTEKYQRSTVSDVLDMGFGIMQRANSENRYIDEGSFIPVYKQMVDILSNPYIDEFNNPYHYLTKYYLEKVYGEGFANIVALLFVRESFGNLATNCENVLEEYEIIG